MDVCKCVANILQLPGQLKEITLHPCFLMCSSNPSMY